CTRLQSVGARILRRGDQDCPRTVDDAAGVPGMVHVLDRSSLGIHAQRHFVEALPVVWTMGTQRLEGWFERGQGLHRGAGARVVVVIKDNLSCLVLHRHNALAKPPVLERGSGSSLARGGKGIELLARKTLQGGDQVRRDTLRYYRMQRPQVGVVAIQPGA